MSVSGIFGSSFSNNQISSRYQLTNSEFQQLGQDLAAGNLSSAQSDFATLQQAFASPVSTASTATSASSTSNPLAQAFQQLSSDLSSGNLTAAQKDYSTIQQDLQSGQMHHAHHSHRFSGWQGPVLFSNDPTVQSGSSTQGQSASAAAQQAYSALAQQLQEYALGQPAEAEGTVANPVSFVA